MKRGASGFVALLALDKPANMTSHDAVNCVRRTCGERRVGHAGTLDPAATGLLLMGVGAATRLLPYLSGHNKEYVAHISFGMATTTDDAQGACIAFAPVQEKLFDFTFASAFVSSLVGEHEQVPPQFSAIKQEGTAAYARAREGQTVALDARQIVILDARLLAVDVEEASDKNIPSSQIPVWEVAFRVSKGTYIRSIARDVGEALGTRAHLQALRRVASGNVSLEDAFTLEQLEGSSVERACINPVTALGFPVVEISDTDILPLGQGKPLVAPSDLPDGLVAMVHEKVLLSVHENTGGILRAKTVIPGGVIGVR